MNVLFKSSSSLQTIDFLTFAKKAGVDINRDQKKVTNFESNAYEIGSETIILTAQFAPIVIAAFIAWLSSREEKDTEEFVMEIDEKKKTKKVIMKSTKSSKERTHLTQQNIENLKDLAKEKGLSLEEIMELVKKIKA